MSARDKLSVAQGILCDTIIGFFLGNNYETTINSSYAVLTLVRDLKNHYISKNQIEDFDLSSEKFKKLGLVDFNKSAPRVPINTTGFGTTHSIIDLATFTKHAKNDPTAIEAFSLGRSIKSLKYAIDDYCQLLDALLENNLAYYFPNLTQEEPLNEGSRISLLKEYFQKFLTDYDELGQDFIETHNLEQLIANSDERRRIIFDEIHKKGLTRPSFWPEVILIDGWKPFLHTISPEPST